MVLSVQDHSLHPPKTWVKLWVKPMRQSSKSPVYQGFSALQVEEVRSLDQTLPGCRANGYTFLKDGCVFEQDVDLSVYIQSFDKESRSAARLYLQGYDRMNIRDRLRLSPARMQQVDARLRRYMQLYMAV